MIDLFHIITTTDLNGDVLIAVPVDTEKKRKWAFAAVSGLRRMVSGFRSRNAIDTLFGATERIDMDRDKGKRLFFNAIFVPHTYNTMADWLPILNTIREGGT